jgi:hypothetical protein
MIMFTETHTQTNKLKTRKQKEIMNTNSTATLTSSNTLTRKFFEKLSLRRNNAHETTVDSVLAWALKEVPATRLEIVALFKSFEKLGWRRFIEGRRGKASRFEWIVNALELAKEVLTDVDSKVQEHNDAETTDVASLDSIQAFFAEKGIESGIVPGPEGHQHLCANIPIGGMWAELTARRERKGAGMFVSLPIFPSGASAKVAHALERVNQGLQHGRFFVTESNMSVIYALKAQIEDRTFGQEEARQLFETAHMEVSPNIVPIFLAAAQWGEEPPDVSLAA